MALCAIAVIIILLNLHHHTKNNIMNHKSRTATILLTLFLGGIGIHRFYLNQPILGALYLLFCWTFIPLVFAIYDLLFVLLLTDKQFDDYYQPKPPTMHSQPVALPLTKHQQLQHLYDSFRAGKITEAEHTNQRQSILNQQ